MIPTNRRVFMMTLAAGTSALAASAALAQAKLDEKDPHRRGPGLCGRYHQGRHEEVPEARRNDQKCSNCQLFQGKADAAEGACPLFAGKVVAANGWCSVLGEEGLRCHADLGWLRWRYARRHERSVAAQGRRIGTQASELMLAAPQVVAHRLGRMALAGHRPSAEGPARVPPHGCGEARRLRRSLAGHDAADAQVEPAAGRVDDAQLVAGCRVAQRPRGGPDTGGRRNGSMPRSTCSARASARCTGARWPTPSA